MVDCFRFTVPGDPVPWGRAGVDTRGGKARHYTPTKTLNFELAVRVAAQNAGVLPIEGPVKLTILTEWAWPKSKERKTKPRNWEWRGSGPDADNVAKAVMDALNGIAYKDDRQVAKLIVTKTRPVQGMPSQTLVYIEPLPPPECPI